MPASASGWGSGVPLAMTDNDHLRIYRRLCRRLFNHLRRQRVWPWSNLSTRRDQRIHGPENEPTLTHRRIANSYAQARQSKA